MSDRLPEPEELAALIHGTCKRFGIDLLGTYSRDIVDPIVLATAMHVQLDTAGEEPEPLVTVCNQEDCGEAAERLVHWPDGKKLPMCAPHAAWASQVMRATGVEPHIEKIEAPT